MSRKFIRVFGAENSVHGCLECLTRAELAVGQAAEPRAEDAGTRWRVEKPR